MDVAVYMLLYNYIEFNIVSPPSFFTLTKIIIIVTLFLFIVIHYNIIIIVIHYLF